MASFLLLAFTETRLTVVDTTSLSLAPEPRLVNIIVAVMVLSRVTVMRNIVVDLPRTSFELALRNTLGRVAAGIAPEFARTRHATVSCYRYRVVGRGARGNEFRPASTNT